MGINFHPFSTSLLSPQIEYNHTRLVFDEAVLRKRLITVWTHQMEGSCLSAIDPSTHSVVPHNPSLFYQFNGTQCYVWNALSFCDFIIIFNVCLSKVIIFKMHSERQIMNLLLFLAKLWNKLCSQMYSSNSPSISGLALHISCASLHRLHLHTEPVKFHFLILELMYHHSH